MGSCDSLAFDDFEDPDFADVQIVRVPPSVVGLPGDPADWARAVFDIRSAPGWVRLLFAVRQALVGLIGVRRGEQGLFDVDVIRGGEALIRADEAHLDFRAAVAFDSARRLLRVVTVVRLHGWRGRVYFAPVSVVHGLITASMMRRAVKRLGNAQPPTGASDA